MKTQVLFLLLLLLAAALPAQEPKGVTPLASPAPSGGGRGEVRAVVVGISDYQDPAIPDLQFADRDAEAFANFLRSPAGGSLDGDHLRLLINEQATGAQLAKTLDWLIEVTKPDDRVIIYFSGHGDVETNRISQPGYLLGWDAPSRVYSAGGAMNVRDFQDIISTLSVQNKAKVVVITDACHSGKLSGSDINGAQLTGQNLARQFNNEVKILSCQPNEYSIEGEQWGGGRGAFSYSLVDALYGLADGNNDLFVTLQEVGRYLEDHVTAEVAPVSQVPMVIGNRTERLASVDAQLLAALRSGKTSQMLMLSPVENRGMEDEVLAGVDTTVRELYRLFKQALKDKVFLEPATACADTYYERLIAEPQLARLHSTLRRNYAAALQDDAQQVMNKWLKTDLNELNLSKLSQTQKYQVYPRYLERAAALLGERHYMYPILQARKCFFEGYLLALSNRNPDNYVGEKALVAFRQALQWQAEQPQVYWQMSNVFGFNLLLPDSAEYYARQAIELYPSWTLLYSDLAFLLSDKFVRYDNARKYLEQGSRIDSNSVVIWNARGVFYRQQKQYAESVRQYKKAIQLDSTYTITYSNLGLVYRDMRRYDEAERQLKKAIQLDSNYFIAHNNLGLIYHETRRYSEAEQQCKKAIQLDSNFANAYITLGMIYNETRRNAEAEQQYKIAIKLDSNFALGYNNLGTVYLNTRRLDEAEQLYKKAIELDPGLALAYNNLGLVYRGVRRYPEAEQQCKKAIQLDSNFANAYLTLGIIYNETRRNAEAEQQYKRAIQLDSSLTMAYNNLGTVYLNTGRLEEAEQLYKKAIELDPDLALAYDNLGLVYRGARRYPEAEQQCKKAIQLDSSFANAYVTLGMIYNETRRNTEAEQQYKTALKLDSSLTMAYNNLGNIYLNTQRLDKAEQQLGKAIQLDSFNSVAYGNLGLVYMYTGRFPESERQLLKAIQLDPTGAGNYYNLACLRSLQKQVEHAFGALELSLKNGWYDYDWMQQDTDLAALRERAEQRQKEQVFRADNPFFEVHSGELWTEKKGKYGLKKCLFDLTRITQTTSKMSAKRLNPPGILRNSPGVPPTTPNQDKPLQRRGAYGRCGRRSI